jgi:isopentenyl-diphosphate delta-isomerase
MAELIDVLSESGLRTGEVLTRAEVHRLGKPHRAVHLYVLNARDELLLQRRSGTVDHAAGVVSISVVGHIWAGEFSSDTVRREAAEELGADVSGWRFDFLFSHFQEATLSPTYIDRQFNDVYVVRADLELEALRFDRTEVAELMLMPFERFLHLVAIGSPDVASVYRNECRDLAHFLAPARAAVAAVLSADPMPVPDDPRDLRRELDEARARVRD